MGVFRGNPVTLTALFFGAAVLLTGGLYAYFPVAVEGPSVGSLLLLGAMAVSLIFTVAIIARIFWVTARSSARSRATRGK